MAARANVDATIADILDTCEAGGLMMLYGHKGLAGSATGTIHWQISAMRKLVTAAILRHQAGRITIMGGDQIVNYIVNQGLPLALREA